MMVCGHGDVADFCKNRDMVICDEYSGDIEKYHGICPVLVTSQNMTEHEYYFLKGKLLARGVELISTIHKDREGMREFLVYQAERRKKNYAGRQIFGCRLVGGETVLTENGRAVVNRIFEMHDSGFTLRQIREDEGVHHPDGRRLSISTVQLIIKNRAKYKL
jgi:hypothetical protein